MTLRTPPKMNPASRIHSAYSVDLTPGQYPLRIKTRRCSSINSPSRLRRLLSLQGHGVVSCRDAPQDSQKPKYVQAQTGHSPFSSKSKVPQPSHVPRISSKGVILWNFS